MLRSGHAGLRYQVCFGLAPGNAERCTSFFRFSAKQACVNAQTPVKICSSKVSSLPVDARAIFWDAFLMLSHFSGDPRFLLYQTNAYIFKQWMFPKLGFPMRCFPYATCRV